MRQDNLWSFILHRLQNSVSVILLCVTDSQGSSPGRQGYKMAVAEDGMSGSIGGGIMEHKFVEMAKEKLNDLPKDPIIRRQIHNKSAGKNQSGMICSGEQTIVLFHLTKMHLEKIKEVSECVDRMGNGVLSISADSIDFDSDNVNDDNYLFDIKSEDEWIYQENIGYKNHLIIVGGGHCALALSKLMSTMDFYIHLYDNRKNLNTFENNSFVMKKTLVAEYSELDNLIRTGENVYVVIMTFGYRSDDVALRSIINKDFKYLGVLGSASKMEKMFEEWRSDNLPEEKLKRIHAPIGVKINSRTPEEIAVSIAAEIIGVKNEVRSKK